jgi:hypothetical protein
MSKQVHVPYGISHLSKQNKSRVIYKKNMSMHRRTQQIHFILIHPSSSHTATHENKTGPRAGLLTAPMRSSFSIRDVFFELQCLYQNDIIKESHIRPLYIKDAHSQFAEYIDILCLCRMWKDSYCNKLTCILVFCNWYMHCTLVF